MRRETIAFDDVIARFHGVRLYERAADHAVYLAERAGLCHVVITPENAPAEGPVLATVLSFEDEWERGAHLASRGDASAVSRDDASAAPA